MTRTKRGHTFVCREVVRYDLKDLPVSEPIHGRFDHNTRPGMDQPLYIQRFVGFCHGVPQGAGSARPDR